MKIVICIKQVPNTTDISINPETNTLIREGVESIINPFDTYAIEEGVRLKEKYGGTAIVLSMGPPQVEVALREALSVGIDEAYLVSDRAFAGSDTLATAYTLSESIKKIGEVDIILTGKQAIDGDTGQVGPGIAANLNMTHITDISKIDKVGENGEVLVERLLENGRVHIKTKMPLLLTVVKEINEPRLPTLRAKMKAKKMEILNWSNDDLQCNTGRLGLTGSPTWVKKIFSPPKTGKGKIFEGDINKSVASLLKEMELAGMNLTTIKENNGNGSN